MIKMTNSMLFPLNLMNRRLPDLSKLGASSKRLSSGDMLVLPTNPTKNDKKMPEIKTNHKKEPPFAKDFSRETEGVFDKHPTPDLSNNLLQKSKKKSR